MRYQIVRSSDVDSADFQRETLADAVWLALNLISQTGSNNSVYIEDTVTKHRWDEEAIDHLAPTLPAWSGSHMS